MTLYWIETPALGRLAIAARPRAGDWLDDEIAGWRREGVTMVLSLLEDDEIADLGLENEPWACRRSEVSFGRYPIPDRGVPASPEAASDIASVCAEGLQRGESLVFHCRAGIGRSSVMAALVLRALGVGGEEAFERIGEARRLAVPDTDAQRHWALHLNL
jgi:protein-tyrosine phosphatase